MTEAELEGVRVAAVRHLRALADEVGLVFLEYRIDELGGGRVVMIATFSKGLSDDRH